MIHKYNIKYTLRCTFWLCKEYHSKSINFVFLRQVFWYISSSSSCFFQFVTTCNMNYKLCAESVLEKHASGAQRYIFVLFLPCNALPTGKLFKRRAGRGSCTPAWGCCIFKESTRYCPRSETWFRGGRNGTALNFARTRLAIFDEIVARGPSPSKFAIRGDRNI